MEFNILELTKEDESKWDNYVHNKNASVYHLSQWRNLIKEVFGHNSLYLIAKNNNMDIVGVLPLIRQKSYLFGDNLISIPYFNYGGAVADDEHIEVALLNEAIERAKNLNIKSIEYRETKNREYLTYTRDNKITMVLDLPEEEETLWSDLGSKRRSQIKRPLREDVEALYGKEEYLDAFYYVFSRNMRDLGTPVYSKSFFKKILEKFHDSITIHIIMINGQPVGGAFIITYNNIVEIPWASTLREFNKFGINMYMYWEVIRKAIADGNKQFDFGRCSKGSGTYKFKKQWGAKPVQFYWNYWLADGVEPSALNPDNPKYKIAIEVWKKLPLFIANRIGPKIVRNLP